MPIYEYGCDACGTTTEVIQKFSDPALTDCPSCGAAALRKRVSAAGFRLSGKGWYETDFKKGGQRNLKDGAPAEPKADGARGSPACAGGSCASTAA